VATVAAATAAVIRNLRMVILLRDR
jgi:hypothetical protein